MGGLTEFVIGVLERRREIPAASDRPSGHLTGTFALEQSGRPIDGASLITIERRHGHSRSLATAIVDEQPLDLEALHRLPGGRPAHAESLGDDGLGQSHAGGEVALNDQQPEARVGVRLYGR